ncbi:MAG: ABC transporter substrate-binding protein [Acidimicrobiales bacterium]
MAIDRDPGGWDPSYNRLDGQAWSAATAIYDPLAAYGVDGTIHPFLAAGIDHDPDHTRWTIRVRPDVTFVDGKPCDAAAIAANLQDRRTSPLHAAAFAPVTSIEVAPTGDAVVVSMAGPYPGFAETLTGPAGLVVAPAALGPFGTPRMAATTPYGSGPFVLDSYEPGSSLRTRRNPDYWQRDGASNRLPYLQSIEFRRLAAPPFRDAALATGGFDVVIGSAPQADDRCQSGYYVCTASARQGVVTAVAFDTAKGPFADPRLRRAAVAATDRERFPRAQSVERADGPQAPGSVAGNPPAAVHDPERARRLVDDATGGTRVAVTLTGTDTDAHRATATALQQQWEAAGFDVTVALTSPAAALAAGDAALVEVGERVGHQQLHDLFHSTGTTGFAPTNVARWSDPVTDQALAAAPTAGYQALWDRVADQAPYLWLNRGPLTFSAPEDLITVNNRNGGEPWRPLPDGTRGDPLTWGGPMLTTAWKQW